MTNLVTNQTDQCGINLFGASLWKFYYKFDWTLLENKANILFNSVDKNSFLEKGAAWSTVSANKINQPHLWPELAHFIEWVKITVSGISKDLNFQTDRCNIINSWINKHDKFGETLEHNHNNVTFVVSCYLQCPENSGNIVFKDPLEYHKAHWPIFPEEHLYQEIKVATNDVLIFPGYLKHYVRPNLSDQSRYVLTLNIS